MCRGLTRTRRAVAGMPASLKDARVVNAEMKAAAKALATVLKRLGEPACVPKLAGPRWGPPVATRWLDGGAPATRGQLVLEAVTLGVNAARLSSDTNERDRAPMARSTSRTTRRCGCATK